MEDREMSNDNTKGIASVASVKSQALTYEQLKARVAELEAMQSQPQGQLNIRINEKNADGTPGKGTISVYGLGRFPVSMYAEQWERLLTDSNIKTILTLAKSPKAVRKVRNAVTDASPSTPQSSTAAA